MANSYTQLYVQMVFAVKNRHSLILPENRVKIEKTFPDAFPWRQAIIPYYNQ